MTKISIFGQFRLLSMVIAMASLVACAGSDTQSTDTKTAESKPAAVAKNEFSARNGYACCNLRYEGDWISDSNLSQLAFIAAGTPIKLKNIESYRAYIEVDGKSMRLGHDYGRTEESTEQWVNKLVVLEDPKLKMTRFPPAIRKAIETGKLMKGMTKEQVIMAVGYPQTNENPKLDAPYWRYWWSSFGPYYVYWSGNKVSKIDGHSETIGHMTYKGK